LLSAVAAVQVRFLDKSWNETWPAANGGAALPRAVELTIKLEEGQEFKRLFTLPNA
jgi:type II secretion system protein J